MHVLLHVGATVLLASQVISAQMLSRDTLDIYWIDVEGGAATLIVTPTNESILMDAGWLRSDERDAQRIQAAMTDAGIDRLNYFITSHFHSDHVGGLTALANRVVIDQFIDHGDSVEVEGYPELWNPYLALVDGKRRSVTPGDTLPLHGMEFMFVTSNGETIPESLLPTGPNALCDAVLPTEPDMGENGQSVGYLLSLGPFQFLNLGDLTVDRQHTLACPINKVGTVDLLQVPHHGNGLAPELLWALMPQVTISSQGPHKGGSADGFEIISQIPGIEDMWQLHRALDTDDAHNTEARLIANHTDEDECLGHWLKATVHRDGESYAVLNGRNNIRQSYIPQ
jgi:beta-lactamase superfamily II metal-dependent hydrolase